MGQGAMNETEWDGGATLWDVDVQGPGTRTVWDPISAIRAIYSMARAIAPAWIGRAI